MNFNKVAKIQITGDSKDKNLKLLLQSDLEQQSDFSFETKNHDFWRTTNEI